MPERREAKVRTAVLLCEGACSQFAQQHTLHTYQGCFAGSLKVLGFESEGVWVYECSVCSCSRVFGHGSGAGPVPDSRRVWLRTQPPTPPVRKRRLAPLPVRPRFDVRPVDPWERTSSWMSGEEVFQVRRLVTHKRPPRRCVSCGSTNVVFNGLNYWCDDCDSRHDLLSDDRTYRWTRTRGGDGFQYAVSKPDPFYEQETRYVREPAATNWPFGRIRPHVKRWHERTKRSKRMIEPKEL